MKKLVIIICVWPLMLLSQGVMAQNVWQTQISPTGSDLVTISFADIMYGWIATEDGTILATENAGSDWYVRTQLENIIPSTLFFINRNTGWITGKYNSVVDSAFILKTTDGGVSWSPVFQSLHFDLNDIFFINETLGWTAGSEISESDTLSLIMYTTDGGENWTIPFGPRVQNELYSIDFRDSNYGQACGQDGLFFSTSNGGLSSPGWSMNIAIPSYQKDLYGISNAGINNGCAVGESGFVLFTKDKWATYMDRYTTSGDTLLAITALPDGSRFWAAGKNGSIVSIRYALYMLMVSEEERITSENLNDICAVDDNHIWAAGDNGTILYYNDNHPPVAVDDMVTVTQSSSTLIFPLENDSDPDDNNLRIYSFTEGRHGEVSISLSGNYLLFDPDNNYTGYDTLQYVVTDDEGGFDSGNIYIEITEPDYGPFEHIKVNFDSVAFGNAIWGDIDKDGDYDIIVCGEKADGTRITSLYTNNSGEFEKGSANLEGVITRNDNAMSFTDINNDGYLDFIITGTNNQGIAVTNLYIYEHGFSYEKYTTGIPGVADGSVDWGDFDNDGDQDLLISGKRDDSGKVCTIYRNNGIVTGEHNSWSFTETNFNFYPLDESIARFVDFNKDDYLDVISMGSDDNENIKGYYYTNSEGLYVVGVLEGHINGSVDYCDYNADGNIEVLATGTVSLVGPNPDSQLLIFEQGAFNEIESGIEYVSLSSADWGDYDNDGDWDLVVSGLNSQLASVTNIYENIDNVLVNSGINLPGMASGTVNWGDYDNDGDLDILMSGYTTISPNRVTAIFRNNTEVQNQSPGMPGNPTFQQSGPGITISWDDASDNETPSGGLTYNVRLKRKFSYSHILYPPVIDESGVQYICYGNAFDNKIFISGLDEGALYTCQVQSVDASFNVSEWAEFQFNTPSDYFTEVDFGIPGHGLLSASWIDYDSDNNLELFIAGVDQYGFSRIYPVADNLPVNDYIDLGETMFNQKATILDLNNDNILDIAYAFIADSSIKVDVTGYPESVTKTGFSEGRYDWGDYDNDGDEDLIITGRRDGENFGARMYRNISGELENFNILISGVIYGDIEWVDFDSDGDMDIALCGLNYSEDKSMTKIYENRGGAYVETGMDLIGLAFSDMDFADYDEDGDVDLLICGITDDNIATTLIYKNENNQYIPTLHSLTPILMGSCRWVDLNGDGHSDIVLSGVNDNSVYSDKTTTKIFIGDNGTFTEAATLQGFKGAVIAPGDFDDDKDTDLFIGGAATLYTKGILFRNDILQPNTYPEHPENINIIAYGDSIRVEWVKGYDPISLSDELTYNIRVGTTPGGTDVISPKSNPNGKRKVVGRGNAGYKTFATIKALSADSVYYLAIQTIDASFLGSPFSEEMAFNPQSGCLVPVEYLIDSREITNAEWIDYDNDSDLDLVVRIEKELVSNPGIYQNNGGDIDTTLSVVESGIFTRELLVNDFDNDNDADILLQTLYQQYQSNMLENIDGVYSTSELDITGLSYSNSAWGDFDNDGYDDLVIMGTDNSGENLFTKLYKNNNGILESYNNLLEPVLGGKIYWVDIDNDGDKDIIRSGYTKVLNTEPEDIKFIISENMGGAFRDIYPDIEGLILGDMDFGDFDNDGDIDMISTGGSFETGEPHSYIYSNENGEYQLTDSITPVFGGCVKWVDIDNDRLLDIVITGYNDQLMHYNLPDPALISEIFRNSGNKFTRIASLKTFANPALAVGDFNYDGRADIFIGGKRDNNNITGIIYTNSNYKASIPPRAPYTEAAQVYDDSVRISWSYPSDRSLYYNLRIGTSPGGNDALSSLSHDDGKRKVVSTGNMQQNFSFTLQDVIPSTTYYYSVQAIDLGYSNSPWSEEKEFVTLPTGIDEILPGVIIAGVYPNPVQTDLNIEMEIIRPGPVTFELYNTTGQKIFNKQINTIPGLNTTTFSIPGPGIFILKILNENTVITRKIISTYNR